MMELPTFEFHRDPVASGSVERSDKSCVCCKKARGAIYVGPVYGEEDLDSKLCPWCIADGSAHKKFDVTFVDDHSLDDAWPGEAAKIIATRTPGIAMWQSEVWPSCCNDATALIGPIGIEEIRRDHRDWEGFLLNHIIYDMHISGGAALRILGSIHRDHGPTAYAFACRHCTATKFHVDQA